MKLQISITLLLFMFIADGICCPCSNASLCNMVTSTPSKEVYGFTVNNSNWKNYKWNILTTIAVFDQLDFDMLCYAHSQNVKVVLQTTDIQTDQLTNKTIRSNWVNANVQAVINNYLDGLNIDFEYAVANNSEEQKALTELVKELRTALNTQVPGAQLSFDVPWTTTAVDGRYYDLVGISQYTDFLFIMDYDIQSQIFAPKPCIAGPNSPIDATKSGVQAYLSLGIPANQLILGVPWYGFDYECQSFSDNVCYIYHVSYRGCDCSDAAGMPTDYSQIQTLQLQAIGGNPTFDNTSESFYFNYQSSNGNYHQVWYDDPLTLSFKYRYAKEQNLLGVGFWNLDSLNYSSTDYLEHKTGSTQDMWTCLDQFLGNDNTTAQIM